MSYKCKWQTTTEIKEEKGKVPDRWALSTSVSSPIVVEINISTSTRTIKCPEAAAATRAISHLWIWIRAIVKAHSILIIIVRIGQQMTWLQCWGSGSKRIEIMLIIQVLQAVSKGTDRGSAISLIICSWTWTWKTISKWWACTLSTNLASLAWLDLTILTQSYRLLNIKSYVRTKTLLEAEGITQLIDSRGWDRTSNGPPILIILSLEALSQDAAIYPPNGTKLPNRAWTSSKCRQ